MALSDGADAAGCLQLLLSMASDDDLKAATTTTVNSSSGCCERASYPSFKAQCVFYSHAQRRDVLRVVEVTKMCDMVLFVADASSCGRAASAAMAAEDLVDEVTEELCWCCCCILYL